MFNKVIKGYRLSRSVTNSKVILESNVSSVPLAYAMYDAEPVADKENAIFILHGLMGTKANWNTISRNLAAVTKRRVFAVDQRNHGESPHTDEFTYPHMAADLKNLINDLKLDPSKISLIGHSLGGRTIMSLVLQEPNIARDIVIVDVSPIGSTPQPEYFMNLLQVLKNMNISKLPHDLTLSKGREIANKKLKDTVKNSGLRNFILTNLQKQKNGEFKWRINIESLLKNKQVFYEMPSTSNSFDKPALFICGRLSPYVKEEHHEGIFKLFPKATIEYFEDSGHLVHVENPDEFLKTVSDFFTKNLNNKQLKT